MKIDKEIVISKEQIEEWKSQYGHVYRTYLEGTPIIWRRLRRKEYEEIIINTYDDDDSDNEENDDEEDPKKRAARMYRRQNMIAKTAVIYPENAMEFLESYAIAITNISDDVMAKSGFDMPTSAEL